MPNKRHISARSTTVEEDVDVDDNAGVSRLKIRDANGCCCSLSFRSDDDEDVTANAAETAALVTEVTNGGAIVILYCPPNKISCLLSRAK
jgi:hypothetical protein